MLAVVAAATSRSALAVGGSTRGRRTTLLAATAGATPSDVLSFWFGSEWHAGVGMDTAEYLKVQTKRWFMGGDDMDAQAQQFVPLIRAAAKGELEKWTSRDGHVARLILLDQLSRNAFRGTEEAFAYDAEAQSVAASLLEDPAALDLPAPAALFVATCLMHSEEMALHDSCQAFLEAHIGRSGSSMLRSQLEKDLPAHTAVLRRFGRYPHRNALRGRQTTAEEAAWLASDDCPGWAKSQTSKSLRSSRQPTPSPPTPPSPAPPPPTPPPPAPSPSEPQPELPPTAGRTSSMRERIVVDSRGAGAAFAPLAGRALSSWAEWRCEAYPDSASGKFEESRWWEAAGREEAEEERCLVTAGRAQLWPHGEGGPSGSGLAGVAAGSAGPIEISAGDWVVFKRGFLCTWVVTEPIAKRYAYFDGEGEEIGG